ILLADKPKAQDGRCRRLVRILSGEQGLELLIGEQAATDQELEHAAPLGREIAKPAPQLERRRTRLDRTDELVRGRVLGDKGRRPRRERGLAHRWIGAQE